MITAGIKDVKNNLSQYLKKVKDGEDVLVTDHGKTIARIIKEPTSNNLEKEKLFALAAKGFIELPKQKYKTKSIPPLPLKGKPLSTIVLEERR